MLDKVEKAVEGAKALSKMTEEAKKMAEAASRPRRRLLRQGSKQGSGSSERESEGSAAAGGHGRNLAALSHDAREPGPVVNWPQLVEFGAGKDRRSGERR